MDLTLGLTLTIIGGIIVGVVVLFIEYGYFKKRKSNSPEHSGSSITEGTTKAPSTNPSNVQQPLVKNEEQNGALPWPNAINKAIETFRTLHQGKSIKIVSTDANVTTASLFIAVYESSSSRRLHSAKFFSLVVDKTGEILSIKQSR